MPRVTKTSDLKAQQTRLERKLIRELYNELLRQDQRSFPKQGPLRNVPKSAHGAYIIRDPDKL